MTLDPRAKRLLDIMAISAPVAAIRLSAQARREGFAKLMQLGARPVSVAHSENVLIDSPDGPLPLRLYDATPDLRGNRPALVFFHGGGLVAGSIDTHDGICRTLANASGSLILSVGYRLAPEAKFPAALNDAVRAVGWISANASGFGINPSRIAIGGESAGALLAALICNGHRTVDITPRAQLLLCPVVDLAGHMPSRQAYSRGFLIDAATISRDIEDCLPHGADPGDLPSPLRNGTPERSPATIIVTAECDPFRDEGNLYADRLSASGVPVWHKCMAGMIHSFYGLSALLPQADTALEEVGRQLAALLSESG